MLLLPIALSSSSASPATSTWPEGGSRSHERLSAKTHGLNEASTETICPLALPAGIRQARTVASEAQPGSCESTLSLFPRRRWQGTAGRLTLPSKTYSM